jgi:hypothetical protein
LDLASCPAPQRKKRVSEERNKKAERVSGGKGEWDLREPGRGRTFGRVFLVRRRKRERERKRRSRQKERLAYYAYVWLVKDAYWLLEAGKLAFRKPTEDYRIYIELPQIKRACFQESFSYRQCRHYVHLISFA